MSHPFPTRRSSDLGVVFVDLAPIRDAALVLPSIARVLGVGEDGDRALEDRLVAALRERELLLILDNVEQVTAAAPQVGRSDEHTSELQSLMRTSYAVFCLKKKKKKGAIMC